MVFEHVEKLQREYTDKYVEIDSDAPELARFRGVPGRVKTVNMSGRALVEFMDYNLNIGWYDIEVDYLKVIDKPEPTAEEKKKPAAKPTKAKSAPTESAEKKLSPLELARMQGAAGKGGGAAETKEAKPSTAEILEAARSKKKAEAPAKPTEKMSTADILAAARQSKTAEPEAAAPAEEESATEPPAEKVSAAADRSKMSTADILAAARASKEAAAPELADEPEDLDEEAVVGEPTLHDAPDEPAAPTPAGKLDKSSMSIDDMLAYCREHDAE